MIVTLPIELQRRLVVETGFWELGVRRRMPRSKYSAVVSSLAWTCRSLRDILNEPKVHADALVGVRVAAHHPWPKGNAMLLMVMHRRELERTVKEPLHGLKHLLGSFLPREDDEGGIYDDDDVCHAMGEACRDGWTDAVEAFLDADFPADLEFPSRNRQLTNTTPLIEAVFYGRPNELVLRLLMQRGAEINWEITDYDLGRVTALSEAVLSWCPRNIRFLLHEGGADPNKGSVKGGSCLEWIMWSNKGSKNMKVDFLRMGAHYSRRFTEIYFSSGEAIDYLCLAGRSDVLETLGMHHFRVDRNPHILEICLDSVRCAVHLDKEGRDKAVHVLEKWIKNSS